MRRGVTLPPAHSPFEPVAPANLIAAYGMSPAEVIRVFFDRAVSASDCEPGDIIADPGGANILSTTVAQYDFNCIDYTIPGDHPIDGDNFDFVPANPTFAPSTGGATNAPADCTAPGNVVSGGPGVTAVQFSSAVSPLDYPPGCFQNQTTAMANLNYATRGSDTMIVFDVGGSAAQPDDWQLVVTAPDNYILQPASGEYS